MEFKGRNDFKWIVMCFLQVSFSAGSIVEDVFLFLAIVVGGFFLAWIMFNFVKLIFRKTTKIPQNLFDSKYRAAFIFLMVVLAGNVGLSFVELPAKASMIVGKLMYLLMIYAVAHLLIKTMEFVKIILYDKFDISVSNNLEERKARTQIDFLQKTGTVIIILVAFAIALMSFERVRELGTSILASAGLAGIILGFAAQKSIANLLAGLQIAFTQPIRYDDAVIVEDQFGKVEEITLTYVVIKLWDERRLVLPISYFIEKPFENWTRKSTDLLGTVQLYADYSLPIDPLREELKRILANEGKRFWDGRLGVVQVTDCTDRSMQVRVLISATNSANAFDLRCVIREAMINFIKDNYPESLPRIRYEEHAQALR